MNIRSLLVIAFVAQLSIFAAVVKSQIFHQIVQSRIAESNEDNNLIPLKKPDFKIEKP